MAIQISSFGFLGCEPTKVKLVGESVRGKPGFHFLGLPPKLCAELKLLIPTAFRATDIALPARKITITLEPTIPSSAHLFDLSFPVATLLLALSEHIPIPRANRNFCGSVALNGDLQAPHPIGPFLQAAHSLGLRQVVLPNLLLDKQLQSLCAGLQLNCPTSLRTFCTSERLGIEQARPLFTTDNQPADSSATPTFVDTRGNWHCKRALTIAVAGCHHTLIVGPPGVGKTQLALATQSILPQLTPEQFHSVQLLHALSGDTAPISHIAPFRSVSFRVPLSTILGGGSAGKPGEVSLASNGILFLDELTDFPTPLLRGLRQPMESATSTIEHPRTGLIQSYPATTTIIAATNPCNCILRSNPQQSCGCDPNNPYYKRKLGGALLDRFALHCQLGPTPASELLANHADQTTIAEVKTSIANARSLQQQRYLTHPWTTNGWASANYLFDHCLQQSETRSFFLHATKKLRISTRWQRHVLAVARTIADLEAAALVQQQHLAEALQYRPDIQS